jgi:hypothetical protein
MTNLPNATRSYCYPNKMGRILLNEMKKLAEPGEFTQLLNIARLSDFEQHPPSIDLDLEFPFEAVSALQAAAESLYGTEAGQSFNLRAGRACLEGGLREFNPLLGIADLPVRMMPLGLKLHLGFDMLAMVFNRFTDQVVTLREDEKAYYWVIERCPVCWGRHATRPCCHLAVGILDEGLSWASGGKHFHVAETQCIASGADACVIEIGRRPIQH